MTEPRDRPTAVANSTSFNGVDFVEVTATGGLMVHFLNGVDVRSPTPTAAIVGGDSVPTVPLNAIKPGDWSLDAERRRLLQLTPQVPGDFSNYSLILAGPAIDIILGTSTFSFKANCPSDFDCAPAPCDCPSDTVQAPPIDYLARDFQSFEQALLAFSSLRYPNWVERSEADLGMVVAEILSAVGDELSYLQDRIAAEGSLPNATQRRSLVSLARLVDYEPQPAISASGVVQCDVSALSAAIPAGARLATLSPDGTQVPFEIGVGLADATNYPVSSLWNYGVAPYWFDDDEQCLAQGATDLWVEGTGFGFTAGQTLLIQTDLPGESLRQVVTLTQGGFETVDPIFQTSGQPTPVTHLVWGPADALTRARDLTKTLIGGNLLPVTQGRRFSEIFAIGTAPASAPNATLAIARRGPNGSDAAPNFIFRYPLAQTPLGWLAGAGPTQPPAPEIQLTQNLPAAIPWTFATNLLDVLPSDNAFTVDPVAWNVVKRTSTGLPTNYDIAGGEGATIRFGENVFGASPNEQDLFAATYRTGLGAAGNVAADSITMIDPTTAGALVTARNPFALTNGADEETADHIRRMAPQKFQAVQYRAVLASDYEAAAENLSWVEKAATSFRWTGSWMTVFTAADPQGGSTISIDEEIQLVELLNRYRLAGYESYAPPPDYLSIDLSIEVCADDGWFGGDVEAGVVKALSGTNCPNGAQGFFFADRFTFGTPLYRSRLESAIQGVPGVNGVHAIKYRQRGAFAGFKDLPDAVTPAPTQILRVENDPSWPERGAIRVIAEGGL